MTGRVHQIDEVIHPLAAGRWGECVPQRDGRRMHGDAAFLLLLVAIEEARTHTLGRDEAIAAHKGVAQRCLAMIHMRQDTHVADVVLPTLQSA